MIRCADDEGDYVEDDKDNTVDQNSASRITAKTYMVKKEGTRYQYDTTY